MVEIERKGIDALLACLRKEGRKGALEAEETKEAGLAEAVSAAYSSQQAFSWSDEAHAVHADLLWNLLSARLCSRSWMSRKPSAGWQVSLISLARLLFRDARLQEAFFGWPDFLQPLLNYGEATVKAYFSMANEDVDRRTAIVRGYLSVVQKLCQGEERAEKLAKGQLHLILLNLLSARDMVVIQTTLQVLGNLAEASALTRKALAHPKSTALDQALQLLKHSDLMSQKLAAALLRILCSETEAREQIRVYDGTSTLLGLLSTNNVRLQWHLAWGLAQLAEDEETAVEMADKGGVHIVLAQMALSTVPSSAPSTAAQASGGTAASQPLDDTLTMLAGLAAVLAQAAQVDANVDGMVEANGIYQMGKLLIAELDAPSLRRNRNYQLLQCALFRVLRLIFSLERHRHLFKRLFPATFFPRFIDVGHYVLELSSYEPLQKEWSGLLGAGDSALEGAEEARAAVETVNRTREPLMVIGSYAVLEQLGAGAFGCVYRVVKKGADESQPLALKEIFMQTGLLEKESNASAAPGDKSFGDIISEVKIIKHQLRHANVVRYRRVFVEGEKLYILMDYIEGASLKDHIVSLKEKRQKFTEERLWYIVVQLVLALRYLHKDKKIIHRDLKPNNVMLSDGDKAVLTDFGLAKHRGEAYLKSTAGTILYSCPEIVQNQPYGEKADIWALGCCAYEMAVLSPPFYSHNMLQLAQIIVEAKYTPLPKDAYSPSVGSLIRSCLTASREKRPDVVGLAGQMGDKLLLHIDRVNADAASAAKSAGSSAHARYGPSLSDSTASFASGLDRTSPAPGALRVMRDSAGSGGGELSASSRQPKRAAKGPARRGCLSADHKTRERLNMSLSRIPRIQSNTAALSSSASAKRASFHRSGSAPSLPSIGKGPPTGHKVMNAWESSSRFPAIQRTQSTTSVGGGDRGDSASGGTVTIQTERLKGITDPILELLGVLHRVVCIADVAAHDDKVNHRRRVVAHFKRQLFAPNSTPAAIKAHLRKLNGQRDESIPLDLGFADYRPVLQGIPLSSGREGGKRPTVTYAELYAVLEMVLEEMRGGAKLGGDLGAYRRPPSRLLTPNMPSHFPPAQGHVNFV